MRHVPWTPREEPWELGPVYSPVQGPACSPRARRVCRPVSSSQLRVHAQRRRAETSGWSFRVLLVPQHRRPMTMSLKRFLF